MLFRQKKSSKTKQNCHKKIGYLSVVIILSVFPQIIAFAQTVDECLACHEDKSLTTERSGKVISLYVDRTRTKKICTR